MSPTINFSALCDWGMELGELVERLKALGFKVEDDGGKAAVRAPWSDYPVMELYAPVNGWLAVGAWLNVEDGDRRRENIEKVRLFALQNGVDVNEIPPGNPIIYYFVKFFPAEVTLNEALEHINKVRFVTIAAASIMMKKDEAPRYA